MVHGSPDPPNSYTLDSIVFGQVFIALKALVGACKAWMHVSNELY